LNARKRHPLLGGGKGRDGEAAGPGKGKLWGWAAVGRVTGEAAPCSCSWRPGQSTVALVGQLPGWACTAAASLPLLSAPCPVEPHSLCLPHRRHADGALQGQQLQKCRNMATEQKKWCQSVALLWWVLKGSMGVSKVPREESHRGLLCTQKAPWAQKSPNHHAFEAGNSIGAREVSLWFALFLCFSLSLCC